jgi:hypothetical protein
MRSEECRPPPVRSTHANGWQQRGARLLCGLASLLLPACELGTAPPEGEELDLGAGEI